MEEFMEISDKDFIESYLDFNLKARILIASSCKNIFKSADENLKKVLALEVFSQYIAYLEDLAMFYYAIKKKKEDPNKSFLFHFQKVFIKENGKYNSKNSKRVFEELEELEKKDIETIISEFGLPNINEISIDPDIKYSIERKFGNMTKAKNQYHLEIRNNLTKIKGFLRNRFMDKDGKELSLVKFYNKLKHGYLIINDDKMQEQLMLPINFINKTDNKTMFEYYSYKCSKENIESFLKQMEIIHDCLFGILTFYLVGIKAQESSEDI